MAQNIYLISVIILMLQSFGRTVRSSEGPGIYGDWCCGRPTEPRCRALCVLKDMKGPQIRDKYLHKYWAFCINITLDYLIFVTTYIVLTGLGSPGSCYLFVIPEDVAMAFTTYLGFAPRIFKGNDHRVGFGFRFGNHADLQILYEFGPQTSTIPLQSTRVRSAPRREVRRPFIELLLRAGILKQASFYHGVDDDDEPR